MPSKSMVEKAREALGELQNDVPALLSRHRSVKVQVIALERDIAYAEKASEKWKLQKELRLLYSMARILVRRIHALKKEELE